MLDSAIMMVSIILVINIIYVSFSTIRVILTLKGQKYIAAVIGTLEIMIYVLGLGLVLDNLDQIENLLAYGIGYGLGVIIGSKIEERLALGYITVNVISSDPEINFTQQLREKGYGVTSWYAYGMEGDRLSMQILTPRKYELHLYETIKQIDEKAFIISYEPKQINGGFWVKQVRKGKIKQSVESEEQAEQQEQQTEQEEQAAVPSGDKRND
ncbi:Uncharacterized protein YebE, UPF0316 family [Pelagirhabdus alkalitolerans]|uniref:UPF0316 protein SAMN05421734_104145 n=1 Tax=Pelagirhabdus alkalitolerans TaxID=1612202 RepID=A0A1G6IUT0_9BACI|nr:DUF2179 domain-containing protein [Pelagirhabdus alkalitolerans]SDC10352.1 Uncharacterized protein YebE, UPF0316 family [Pelagirhabdus alkalitolerans]